jgi:hypothetical protein
MEFDIPLSQSWSVRLPLSPYMSVSSRLCLLDTRGGAQRYPNGYMAVGYLLFLQERIKGIIITLTCTVAFLSRGWLPWYLLQSLEFRFRLNLNLE